MFSAYAYADEVKPTVTLDDLAKLIAKRTEEGKTESIKPAEVADKALDMVKNAVVSITDTVKKTAPEAMAYNDQTAIRYRHLEPSTCSFSVGYRRCIHNGHK